MSTSLWHDAALGRLTTILQTDETVRGLVLTGSLGQADAQPDEWSDLDFTLVTRDDAYARFYPSMDWLTPVGEVYAFARHSDTHYGVLRAFFVDGRRMDFVIARESALAEIDNWSHNSIAFGARCLFSRSEALNAVLARTFARPIPSPPSQECFQQLANEFWFKGMLAAGKIARGDLLVALHLSLDMIRDCAVLAMMLRDRETGTDHHRNGSAGDHFVAELEATRQAFTADGILRSVERSAGVFDDLTARWAESCAERRGPLLDWVGRVRRGLRHEGR